MPLSHLLDTSVLCQPIKDSPHPGVLARWSDIGDESTCTSAICIAEILQGLEQRASEKYWNRYRGILKDQYAGLSFDSGSAQVYGRLAAQLKAQGSPKPVVDLMIAATAKQHGLIVATLNMKHFAGIPGLAVEDWSST
jgi:predicted nucleic acid-binding protein